ncbi:MAG: HAD-IC family P-type ATPase, partial [Lentihominibacter sp.]
DNAKSAADIAQNVGISEVRSQLMPDDKLSALKDIRKKIGPVMFVGDGINDAPVLAGADVGAAMGTGADAAIEAADVVFMNSSVESIPQSITIAKNTNTIAVQNIVIALFVKLLVILLGFIGFANIWAAIFADTGVAMICILNSLRILWKKY